MTDTTTTSTGLTAAQIASTALIRLVRGAVSGTNTWGDVGTKVEQLFQTNVVDPAELFIGQFDTDFGKAALQEAETVIGTLAPQIIANPEQIGTIIAAQTPVVLSTLAQKAITIAETDALQDASAVVGNALRVQATAVLVSANSTAGTPSVPSTADTSTAPVAAVEPPAENVAAVSSSPSSASLGG